MAHNPVCPNCHLAHPTPEPATMGDPLYAELDKLRACVDAQAAAMGRLLDHAGKKAKCDGPNCGAPGFWVTHTNGKRVLYTPAGLNHFVDCPDSARFHKGARA